MATTTSNFGWPIPQSTDLVKDGATAIASLGSGVDTSMAELKGGTTGQILSKTSNTDMDFTWVTPNPGDITGVIAGTGLTGGGTSGSVTLDFDIANYGGGQYAAGKNKIINGDFGIWQRGAGAFTTSAYSADRWTFYGQGTSTSHSATQQTFTAGTAPVAGYEATYFYRDVITSGSDAATQMILIQKIEDVRMLAGQTVTVSFWAKAASGTPKIGIEFYQDFGSGGSGAVSGTGQSVTLSTSWARYSATFSVPSISGKTIGTGSALFLNLWLSSGSSSATRSGSIGLQSATFDIWGVQVEAGSTATPFQTATGTKQGELAACQRYYSKTYAAGTSPATVTNLGCLTYKTAFTDSYQMFASWRTPVEMRTTPTVTLYSPNTGATGKIYNGSADVNGTAAGYIASSGVSPFVNNVSIAASNLLTVHLVAEAEL